MARLSVITITLNEERNIAECLEGVRWADEILVVDSGSTDRTVELAKQLAARVLSVEWQGYGGTRRAAIEQAQGEWILWLDADERVPGELADEIQRIVRDDDRAVDGYMVGRRAFFLGKWIRHAGWYPSRVTRLFRKSRGTFNDSRVHERLEVSGRIGTLKHDLLHYTDPDLHHYVAKFNRYTSLAAEDMHAAGKRFSVFDLLVRPPFLFVKMYFLRLGFLDGLHGFVLSILSSAYVFTKYAKLWELNRTNRMGGR